MDLSGDHFLERIEKDTIVLSRKEQIREWEEKMLDTDYIKLKCLNGSMDEFHKFTSFWSTRKKNFIYEKLRVKVRGDFLLGLCEFGSKLGDKIHHLNLEIVPTSKCLRHLSKNTKDFLAYFTNVSKLDFYFSLTKGCLESTADLSPPKFKKFPYLTELRAILDIRTELSANYIREIVAASPNLKFIFIKDAWYNSGFSLSVIEENKEKVYKVEHYFEKTGPSSDFQKSSSYSESMLSKSFINSDFEFDYEPPIVDMAAYSKEANSLSCQILCETWGLNYSLFVESLKCKCCSKNEPSSGIDPKLENKEDDIYQEDRDYFGKDFIKIFSSYPVTHLSLKDANSLCVYLWIKEFSNFLKSLNVEFGGSDVEEMNLPPNLILNFKKLKSVHLDFCGESREIFTKATFPTVKEFSVKNDTGLNYEWGKIFPNAKGSFE